MFSSTDYSIYEHEGAICITVTHNRPAIFDTDMEITVVRGSATRKLPNYRDHWGELYIVNLIVAGQQ